MYFKSFIFFVLTFFITLCLFAQNQYVNRYDPYDIYVDSVPVKSLFPKGLKTVIMEQTFLENETNFVRNFDEENRLYEFHSEPEGHGDHFSYTRSFDDEGGVTGTYTMYASNGNVDFKITHEENKKGEPLKQVKEDGKGKLIEEIVWEYNEDGLLIHTNHVESDKRKLVNEWFYEYDESGEMTKTSLKDSKGKTEFEWIYKTNEEQNTMQAGKGQIFINTWTETEDEFYLVNDQRFDEKGGELHHIWRYYAVDTTIEAYLVYNETNKLVYKAEYDHSINKPLQIKTFEDGKVENKGVYKYEEGLMTNYSEYDSKNELIEHHLYIYNDEGFMTRARIYDDRNKNERTIVIKYRFEDQ